MQQKPKEQTPPDTFILSLNLDDLSKIIKDGQTINAKQLQKIETAILQQQKEEKILGVTKDTFYTASLTIAIFVAGIIAERLKKWFEQRASQKETKTLFTFHATRIRDKYLPVLSTSYENLANELDVDKGVLLSPPQVFSSDFEKINLINHKELFSSYQDKELLASILAEINFTYRITQEVNTFHEKVLSKSNKIREDLQALTESYLTALVEFCELIRDAFPDNYISHKDYVFVNDMIIKFHSDIAGTRGLTKFYKEIIRPTQEYFVTNNLFRESPQGLRATELGKILSYRYNELKSLTQEISNQYKTFFATVADTRKSLDKNLGKLK